MIFFSPAFKKLSLSGGMILLSIAYAVFLRTDLSSGVTEQTENTLSETPSKSYEKASAALLQTLSQITEHATSTVTTNISTVPVVSTQNRPMMPMMQNVGTYKNGSYTGSVVDAYYGSVQVKAVVRNGKIADVLFLQYPNDRQNSRYINDQAMPLLKQEAVQAQNAQVDGVSGATFTSEAFIKSLSSALALAKN